MLRSGFAHTSRVYPMGFRQLLHSPVILGKSSRPTLNRQIQSFQLPKQLPTDSVDSSSTKERRFRLSQDLLQKTRFVFEEVLDILSSLGNVAFLTSKA